MGDDECLMRCIRILHVFRLWNQWRFCRLQHMLGIAWKLIFIQKRLCFLLLFGHFCMGHFATKLRFHAYILLVKMQDDDAWGRYKKILETLKFDTVWFIPVLFYVMVVFSVVVPIASRFNYQVDMLLLLINHPCSGAPPLLRVSLNSLSAWSGQLSWRDTAVTYLQTLRLENTVLQRTTNKH